MHISNQKKALILVLELDTVLKRTGIMPQV
jgi:hypothetical protein